MGRRDLKKAPGDLNLKDRGTVTDANETMTVGSSFRCFKSRNDDLSVPTNDCCSDASNGGREGRFPYCTGRITAVLL